WAPREGGRGVVKNTPDVLASRVCPTPFSRLTASTSEKRGASRRSTSFVDSPRDIPSTPSLSGEEAEGSIERRIECCLSPWFRSQGGRLDFEYGGCARRGSGAGRVKRQSASRPPPGCSEGSAC